MADNTLKFVLTADDKTAAAFLSAQTAMKGMSQSAASLKGMLGTLGVGLSAGAFVGMIKSSIDSADALKDLSVRTHTSIKDLASLQLSAEQNGTSLESVAKGIQRLSLSVGQAQRGSEEVAQSLKNLGVNSGDARERLFQLADAYAKTGGDTRTLADLQKVLGKSYAELIPILDQGGTALRKAAEESETFAQTMARMAPDADRFNDQFALMKQNAAGASGQFASALLPSLNQYMGALNEIIASGTFLDKLKFFSVGYINPDVADKVTDYANRTSQLRAEIDRLKKSGEDAGPVIARLNKLIAAEVGRIQQPPLHTAPGAPQSDKPGGAIGPSPGDKFIESLKLKIATADAGEYAMLRMEAAQKKVSAGAEPYIKKLEEAKAASKEWEESNKAAIDDAIASNKEWIDTNKKFADAGKEVFESTRTEDEKLSQTYVELDALLEAGAITWDTYGRAVFAAQDKFSEVKDAGKDMTDALKQSIEGWGRDASKTFTDWAFGAKVSIGDVGQAFAKEMFNMMAYRAVFKPAADALMTTDVFSGIAGFFGGGKATGGPVQSGMTYLVGEQGPELLHMGSSGAITPNSAIGGSNVVVNITNNGNNTQTSASSRQEGGATVIDVLVEQVESAMGGRIARGNGLAPVLEQKYRLNPAAGAV